MLPLSISKKNCSPPASGKSTPTPLGEYVMRELKKIDKVAYIRFASVYRNFEDVDAFSQAIREVSPAEAAARASARKSRAKPT